MATGKRRGPEKDPKDRGRLRKLGQQVHEIMASDAFLDAIVEASTDEKALGELKANPKAHLERKGVKLPAEVDVEFSEESPWCITFCWGWWIFRVCYRFCF